jgi:hypothetical protein
VHLVFAHLVGLHRQKGPRANMQGDTVKTDFACREPFEKIVRKMKSGRRRRDRALV